MVKILFESVQTILKDHFASADLNRVWWRNFSISSKKSVAFKHVKQGVYKQIITGDEAWIYAYDPETTGQ